MLQSHSCRCPEWEATHQRRSDGFPGFSDPGIRSGSRHLHWVRFHRTFLHFLTLFLTNREAASRCPTFKLWRFYPVITSLQNIYKHAPCFRWVSLMSKNNIAWNQPQFLLLLWTKTTCSSVSRVYFFFVITIFFFFSWFWRQGVICCPLLSDSAHCKSSQILFWSSQEVSLWAGVCHNNGELVMRNKIAAITF